jgi:hypothetical protein
MISDKYLLRVDDSIIILRFPQDSGTSSLNKCTSTDEIMIVSPLTPLLRSLEWIVNPYMSRLEWCCAFSNQSMILKREIHRDYGIARNAVKRGLRYKG